MTQKVLLLSLSVLLIVKVTLGEIDCKKGPFKQCKRPKMFDEIPTEVSDFNELCAETKSYLRCTKDYQDECGTKLITLYHSPGIFEASYNTISDACEDGTLLNLVATENLKCFNETFGKTNCRVEAGVFVEPIMKREREDENYEYTFGLFCLDETHATDCVVRAVLENCGEIAGEATYEFIRRSKTLEYACSVEEAQAVLEALENLDLSEDKKKSMSVLLEKMVEENSK
ncbi:unnamed protein product [Larinioides sclopetarius]|uniref:Uncharacterized protein n=1 Tax=Larinioides sclopetarius TaxID=280406 RepID=A0AAV2BNM3_9ARAC